MRVHKPLLLRAQDLCTLTAVAINEATLLREKTRRLRVTYRKPQAFWGDTEMEDEPEFLWPSPEDWTFSFTRRERPVSGGLQRTRSGAPVGIAP